jgi:streptogrisin C
VLTAGHCVLGSGLTAPWSHHGKVIGRAALQGLHQGSSADVGAIEIDPSETSDQMIGSDVSDFREITATAPNASQTVGAVICRSGATSGWGCGSIVAADVDAGINGIRIRHGWWIDIPSARGDSGSPVVDARGRAAGIVIGTTATRSLYSTVDGVAAELGLRPCLDPSCE